MASFEPQDFGLDEPPARPTTPPVRRGFVLILLVLCFMAGLVYGIPVVAERTGYAWESGRSKAAIEALEKLDKAGVIDRSSALFRLATVAVSPAVVNIQTKTRRRDTDAPGLALGGGANRFGRDALELQGIGSGVIIDRDHGYIVTNNHVIQGADAITVRLSQGAEIPARLVGADSKTDLAVLQIKAPVKVAAAWGDSDKLAIGDWVLAIGSPYMLDHTVTAGIISATGRNNLSLPGMDENSYQDFLQTDAAINPGNSGGPLIDLNGKIVGINTAILTNNSFLRGEGGHASGGFEGIGLAIPSSMARKVVDGLIRDGKVVRGFLGVALYPRPLPPEIVKDLNLKDSRGALITHVQPGSPADKAGLKAGDVVVKLGAKEIPDTATLRIRTAELTPGDEVPLEYFRGGKLRSLNVVIGDQAGPGAPSLTPYGFRAVEVLAGPRGETALVIDQVAMGSPAARAGLKLGYRLLAVGPTEVHTLAEFNKAEAAYSLDRGIPLLVQSPDGQIVRVTVGGPVGAGAGAGAGGPG